MQLLDRHALEAEADALRNVLRRLDVVILHVHDADGQLLLARKLFPEFDLGHLAVGELQDELVDRALQDAREERLIASLPDRSPPEVAEAHVHSELRLDPVHRALDLLAHRLRPRHLVRLEPVLLCEARHLVGVERD